MGSLLAIAGAVAAAIFFGGCATAKKKGPPTREQVEGLSAEYGGPQEVACDIAEKMLYQKVLNVFCGESSGTVSLDGNITFQKMYATIPARMQCVATLAEWKKVTCPDGTVFVNKNGVPTPANQ